MMMKASVRGQSCKYVVVVVYRILPVRRRARPLSLRAPDAKQLSVACIVGINPTPMMDDDRGPAWRCT